MSSCLSAKMPVHNCSDGVLLTREIACPANSLELDCLDNRRNHGTMRECKRWRSNMECIKDRLTIYQVPSCNSGRSSVSLPYSESRRGLQERPRARGLPGSRQLSIDQLRRSSRMEHFPLTSLEEACILLNMNVPTASIDAVVPEAFYRLALSHADDDSADVDHELYGNDRPQKYPSRLCRGNNAEKQNGVRYSTEARAHNRKYFTQEDPFD